MPPIIADLAGPLDVIGGVVGHVDELQGPDLNEHDVLFWRGILQALTVRIATARTEFEDKLNSGVALHKSPEQRAQTAQPERLQPMVVMEGRIRDQIEKFESAYALSPPPPLLVDLFGDMRRLQEEMAAFIEITKDFIAAATRPWPQVPLEDLRRAEAAYPSATSRLTPVEVPKP
jgi:hypothetical protein